MRRLALIALTAVALLGGCATIPTDMEWVREDDDTGPRLVLQQGWVIQRPVTFSCRPASGLVDLTLVGLRRNGAVIELHSGKIWRRYAGSGVTRDGPNSPMEIRAPMNVADPVLARIAETGELTVVQGDVKTRTPNAFAPAHDFLAICRGG